MYKVIDVLKSLNVDDKVIFKNGENISYGTALYFWNNLSFVDKISYCIFDYIKEYVFIEIKGE